MASQLSRRYKTGGLGGKSHLGAILEAMGLSMLFKMTDKKKEKKMVHQEAFSWRIRSRNIWGTGERERGRTTSKGEAEGGQCVATKSMLTNANGESGCQGLGNCSPTQHPLGKTEPSPEEFLTVSSFLSSLASCRPPRPGILANLNTLRKLSFY